jgi:hypothetical protein
MKEKYIYYVLSFIIVVFTLCVPIGLFLKYNSTEFLNQEEHSEGRIKVIQEYVEEHDFIIIEVDGVEYIASYKGEICPLVKK